MRQVAHSSFHVCLFVTIAGFLGCGTNDQQAATSETTATENPTEAETPIELSVEDQRLVDEQRICPVGKGELGSMGTPVKVMVDGDPVFICCEHCRESLLANPEKFLPNIAEAKKNRGLHDQQPESTESDDSEENT